MTRETISLTLPDVSAFARALARDLGDTAPSHQSLLNVVARAGGYRNFQHLKAVAVDAPPAAPVDGRAVTRALERFDAAGRLTDWPARRKIRTLCLWALWAQVPPRVTFSEREISALFDELATFADAAQIRRSLIEEGLLTRTRDGAVYARVEAAPDPTAQTVIATVTRKRAA